MAKRSSSTGRDAPKRHRGHPAAPAAPALLAVPLEDRTLLQTLLEAPSLHAVNKDILSLVNDYAPPVPPLVRTNVWALGYRILQLWAASPEALFVVRTDEKDELDELEYVEPTLWVLNARQPRHVLHRYPLPAENAVVVLVRDELWLYHGKAALLRFHWRTGQTTPGPALPDDDVSESCLAYSEAQQEVVHVVASSSEHMTVHSWDDSGQPRCAPVTQANRVHGQNISVRWQPHQPQKRVYVWGAGEPFALLRYDVNDQRSVRNTWLALHWPNWVDLRNISVRASVWVNDTWVAATNHGVFAATFQAGEGTLWPLSDDTDTTLATDGTTLWLATPNGTLSAWQ